MLTLQFSAKAKASTAALITLPHWWAGKYSIMMQCFDCGKLYILHMLPVVITEYTNRMQHTCVWWYE